MDEKHRETAPADNWRETLAQTIEQHRRRIGERIAGQRDKLKQLKCALPASSTKSRRTLRGSMTRRSSRNNR